MRFLAGPRNATSWVGVTVCVLVSNPPFRPSTGLQPANSCRPDGFRSAGAVASWICAVLLVVGLASAESLAAPVVYEYAGFMPDVTPIGLGSNEIVTFRYGFDTTTPFNSMQPMSCSIAVVPERSVGVLRGFGMAGLASARRRGGFTQ